MSQYQPRGNTLSSAPSQRIDETKARNGNINDPQRNKADASNTLGEYDEITPEQAERAGLPEQKHAGAVGYGPNYATRRASIGDKIIGVKDQIVGKVTNNPELVQKGHDRRTGELKRKTEEEHNPDPFVRDEGTSVTSSPGPNKDVPSTSNDINNSSARVPRTQGGGVGGTSNDDPDISSGQSNLITLT